MVNKRVKQNFHIRDLFYTRDQQDGTFISNLEGFFLSPDTKSRTQLMDVTVVDSLLMRY